MKTIVATVGHIAAGKTSTLRAIHAAIPSTYISEGSIKRSFVDGYDYRNSLDEDLRDKGYREAIQQAVTAVRDDDLVLLDASFHRAFRREWLYEELRKAGLQDEVVVVWLFCFCCDENEIARRIQERAEAKVKTADNQADNILVHNHIVGTFDGFTKDCFPDDFCAVFIKLKLFEPIE